MWFERWFLSSNAKDIGVLYLIYALFSGLVGTAFSVLIRLELSGPGVQFIADNQLYNSIITAHAVIMIFFMVEKYFILKSQSFTLFKKVNSDNNNPSLSESNNENNDNNKEDYSNNDNNSNNKKHNYVKVLVDDPFNNRDIILNVTKKQKGVYLWETLDGKHMYVGHSINLYNRISSYNFHTLSTSSVPSSKQAMRDSSVLSPLNPWFLTGFFLDGESSFYIIMHRSNSVKTGWYVRAIFETHLHLKDKALLEKIQASLGGVGSITTRDNQVSFKIFYKDLAVLIDHFDNYPLITKKRADFELFKKVLELMNRQEHLTPEGLIKIVSLKASMNRGLSEDLQTTFPIFF